MHGPVMKSILQNGARIFLDMKCRVVRRYHCGHTLKLDYRALCVRQTCTVINMHFNRVESVAIAEMEVYFGGTN